MPRYRSTIVLFVIAVISVAIAVYTYRHDALAVEETASEFAVLGTSAVPVDLVDRITLIRGESDPMVFERHGMDWRQVQPFPFPMDSFSIRKLAVDAAALRAVDTVERGHQDGSEGLGLDPPQATLTLRWADGSRTIHFGRRTVGGRGYISVDDDPETVYVVPRSLHDRVVDMEPKEWRSRRLFRWAGPDSLSVQFRSPDLVLQIERDRRTWRMTEPLETRLDQVKTEEFLGRLEAAQFDGFLLDDPDDLAQFGLAQPAIAISVISRRPGAPSDETETERILIGDPQGARGEAFYAMQDGGRVVFSVAGEAVSEVLVGMQNLIDLTASGAEAADVFRLRITTPDAEFDVERDRLDPTRWTIDQTAADARVVDQLLGALTTMAATAVRVGEFDHERMVAQIVLFGADLRPIDTVRISTDPAGGWWFDNGDGLQRQFPDSVNLPLSPAALAGR